MSGVNEMGAGTEPCENPLALFHSQPQIAAISWVKGRESYEKRTEDQEGREQCACVREGEKEREEGRNKNSKLLGSVLLGDAYLLLLMAFPMLWELIKDLTSICSNKSPTGSTVTCRYNCITLKIT